MFRRKSHYLIILIRQLKMTLVFVELWKNIQKLANENKERQKYTDPADLNINWVIKKRGGKGSRISLIDGYYISDHANDNKDNNIVTNVKKVNEEEDFPLKIGVLNKIYLNVINLMIIFKIINFLQNIKIQKFKDMIKK